MVQGAWETAGAMRCSGVRLLRMQRPAVDVAGFSGDFVAGTRRALGSLTCIVLQKMSDRISR